MGPYDIQQPNTRAEPLAAGPAARGDPLVLAEGDPERVDAGAITALDLFCGAGGFTEGLLRAGIRVVGALDSWDRAARTYRLNFDHPVAQADIRTLSVGDFRAHLGLGDGCPDVVVGGPPCQGFSIQRIGASEDARNDLIFEFARFVIGLRPRMFVMENVPGLLGGRGRRLATRFEDMLRAEGYAVHVARVNAAAYGVPQTRNRIFYYGWLAGSVAPFIFPQPTHEAAAYVTVMDAMGDLPSPPADRTPAQGDPLHRRTYLSPLNQERLRHIPPGGGFENLPVDLRVNAHKKGADSIGHRYVYGRLAPDKPAGTITARFDSFTRGRFAHPLEDRNITLREGARLQTFPDTHRFEGTQEDIAALIGNAVPPRLAEIIGRAIVGHLLDERGGPMEYPDAAQWGAVQLRLFEPAASRE